MGYAMQSPSVRHQLKIIAQGTKVLGISATRLSEINIPVPDISEQEKIASFLLSVDQRIIEIKSQIAVTNKYKHSLLKDMFI